MLLTILCLAPGKWTTVLKKHQYRQHFKCNIHDRSNLQQAKITELMETMFSVSTVRLNDQRQSFTPLANSTVD